MAGTNAASARGSNAGGSADRVQRLTNADNGLELRRWTVVASGQQVRDVVGMHASRGGGRALEPLAMDRLKRNGLRFVRVPLVELDSMLALLGGATINRSEWHGQATDWRSLHDRAVPPSGQAVAIDGRVRRYDRGEFRLMIRSWTAPMETGPMVHLEVLPQHRRERAGSLQRVLGQQGDQVEAFATMALDVQLEPGFAYVLLSESPQVEWPEVQGAGGAGMAGGGLAGGGRVTPPASASRRGRVGPDDGIGPEVAPPLTLGEMLLPVEISPPTRELLVFVPRVPAELMPPDRTATADERR